MKFVLVQAQHETFKILNTHGEIDLTQFRP